MFLLVRVEICNDSNIPNVPIPRTPKLPGRCHLFPLGREIHASLYVNLLVSIMKLEIMGQSVIQLIQFLCDYLVLGGLDDQADSSQELTSSFPPTSTSYITIIPLFYIIKLVRFSNLMYFREKNKHYGIASLFVCLDIKPIASP